MTAIDLTLTEQQRDGLFQEIDGYRDWEDSFESQWWGPRWSSIIARVSGDLLLPDITGSYRLRSVNREELIEFLEHTIKVAPEGGLEESLRAWHTSVVLLETLGHTVDGSIYDGINCSCMKCVWTRECESRCKAEIAELDHPDDATVAAIGQRYLDAVVFGPDHGDDEFEAA